MKHYMDARSGSCRRVSTVIEHLGLGVDEVFIDLLAGGNQTPDFLALNPNGMVPVLVDGKTTLWEASAIMIYLCEKVKDQTLWPIGSARLDVLRWMFWAGEHFRQSAPIYFEENVIAKLMSNTPNQSRLDEAGKRLSRFAPILENQVAKQPFVCGDQPTLADIDLAAALSQISRTGIPYHNYPNIMSWNDRLGDHLSAWGTTGQRLNDKMDASLL